MKQISNFQDFEQNSPLDEKITPQIAEALAIYFSQEEPVNEAGFLILLKIPSLKLF